IVYKYGEGVHEFYKCGKLIAVARFGMRDTRILEKADLEVSCKENRDLLTSNQTVIHAMEFYIRQFLKRNVGEQIEQIVIPWSGGKDSTAVLLTAIEVFGRNRVVALFSDTGVEFPETLDYIERVTSQLGINLHVEKARLGEAIKHRGLPRLGDRWCTGLKLEALKRGMDRIAKEYRDYIVIIGDRDAESKIRVKRPPVRIENNHIVLSPLKLFSGAQIELYIKSKGIPLNPLYEKGFYRVGCYICPSLRHWELSIMEKAGLTGNMRRNTFFNMFLKERMPGEDD
ncbi:MAG: phosphoadenosine phosphosulfate reductase family protein, partial [Desulfurococcales archaeon]|nr:phosphoadenosine phosphosulfate reductase family protein [Desulfurococcales archaeon]